VNCQKLVFSSHAIQQMFFRRISKQSVKTAIIYGEIIEENLDDRPFPSYLILDFIEGQPIHIVFSYDRVTDTGYVVTAYIPNPDLWINNYKKRR
jgi:hypothetical protein